MDYNSLLVKITFHSPSNAYKYYLFLVLYFLFYCIAYNVVSTQTADEYLMEYNSRRGNDYSRFHGYTYDGVWAAALAIQYVAQHRKQFVKHFEYRVKEWENIFLEALRNTSFEGVTVSEKEKKKKLENFCLYQIL